MASTEVPGPQSADHIIRDIQRFQPDAPIFHHAVDAYLGDVREPYIYDR